MKILSRITVTTFLWALTVFHETRAGTNILAGLEYCEPPGYFPGLLTFMLTQKESQTGRVNSSQIFEFHFATKALKKVAACPAGIFIPSSDGLGGCVLFGEESKTHTIGTNAFLYWKGLGTPRIVALPAPPESTEPLAGHIFFAIAVSNGTRILDCDIRTGNQQIRELPGASLRNRERYDLLHASAGSPGWLHFKCYVGDPVPGGDTSYETGWYRLEVASGKISWISRKEDEEPLTYKFQDGRYVEFEGGGAIGSKLIASPYSTVDREIDDPHGKLSVVLKRFSTLGTAVNVLRGISPGGRYALIMHQEEIAGTGGGFGYANTYYVVDAKGKTTTLIKDNVFQKTGEQISDLWWVGSATE